MNKLRPIFALLVWVCCIWVCVVDYRSRQLERLCTSDPLPRHRRWRVSLDHGLYIAGSNLYVHGTVWGVQIYDPYHDFWTWDWWDGPMPFLQQPATGLVIYSHGRSNPGWVTNAVGAFTGQGIESYDNSRVYGITNNVLLQEAPARINIDDGGRR